MTLSQCRALAAPGAPHGARESHGKLCPEPGGGPKKATSWGPQNSNVTMVYEWFMVLVTILLYLHFSH